jgi:rRNA maturation RNase YbeY
MTHRNKINLELTDYYTIDGISLKNYEQNIRKILEGEGLNRINLNVILVDDEYLRSLHREYLQEDSYTDVMTFPIDEGENREAEIYVSLDRARHNAKRFNVRIDEEIARLIIHGLLHLKGFDDKNKISQTKMRREENRLLKTYWHEIS